MRPEGKSMSSPYDYEIERRIRSLRNTAKVAEAIQMATSDKLGRAQERVAQSRPYAEQLRELVSRLARARHNAPGMEVVLLSQRPVHTICYMLFTPDRSLTGALSSNINLRAASSALEQQETFGEQGTRPKVVFIAVGREGRDFIVRNQLHMLAEFTNYGDRPSLRDVSTIAEAATDAFLEWEVDVVFLVYARFVNTVTQVPTVVQLLPVPPPIEENDGHKTIEYIYEPDAAIIFEALLPRNIDLQVYQALLETLASEHSARLVAMMDVIADANELIHDLTAGL